MMGVLERRRLTRCPRMSRLTRRERATTKCTRKSARVLTVPDMRVQRADCGAADENRLKDAVRRIPTLSCPRGRLAPIKRGLTRLDCLPPSVNSRCRECLLMPITKSQMVEDWRENRDRLCVRWFCKNDVVRAAKHGTYGLKVQCRIAPGATSCVFTQPRRFEPLPAAKSRT